MAKKTTETIKQASTAKGPVWKIGLFRNEQGKLCTVYVRADGTPMPYETKRVGGREILRTGKYEGMKYSEARQLLLAEAKAAGLVDEQAQEPKAEAWPTEPEPKETAKPKTSRRAAKRAATAE